MKRLNSLGLIFAGAAIAMLVGGYCQAQGKQVKQEEKVTTTASGLKYVDLVVGTGTEAKTGMKIQAGYVGRFEDGKVFDKSAPGKGYDLVLGAGQVIKGWDEGIVGMKVGGKRKLIVPGHLAYGKQGYINEKTGKVIIPPDATLIFEVELLSAQ